jgi:ribosomal protein L40E
MTICSKCGQPFEAGMKFCGKCGAKVEEKAREKITNEVVNQDSESCVCEKCGADVTVDDTNCPNCGIELEEDEEVEPLTSVDKSREDMKFSTSRGYFNTLKSLGQFFEFLGGLSFLLGIIFLIKSFSGSGGSDAAWMLTVVLAIAGGLLLFLAGLFFVVQAESGLAILEIERYTFQTAQGVREISELLAQNQTKGNV